VGQAIGSALAGAGFNALVLVLGVAVLGVVVCQVLGQIRQSCCLSGAGADGPAVGPRPVGPGSHRAGDYRRMARPEPGADVPGCVLGLGGRRSRRCNPAARHSPTSWCCCSDWLFRCRTGTSWGFCKLDAADSVRPAAMTLENLRRRVSPPAAPSGGARRAMAAGRHVPGGSLCRRITSNWSTRLVLANRQLHHDLYAVRPRRVREPPVSARPQPEAYQTIRAEFLRPAPYPATPSQVASCPGPDQQRRCALLVDGGPERHVARES